MKKNLILKLIASVLILPLVMTFTACGKTQEVKESLETSLKVEQTTQATTTETEKKQDLDPSPSPSPAVFFDLETAEGEVIDFENLNAYPLTGLPFRKDDLEAKKRPIIAVMLDNHEDARPQSAYSLADIIYEERVEGNYTRYMALFQSHAPKLIGPVRSARGNFIDRLEEYSAIYAHCGASDDADNYLTRNPNIANCDAMFIEPNVMWRYGDTGRFAPHNLYTAFENVAAWGAKRGFAVGSSEFKTPFNIRSQFQALPESLNPVLTTNLQIDFGQNTTSFSYEGDETKVYKRYKYDVQDKDEATGEPVLATNIIVQFADSRVYDDKGHKEVDQIGSGEGLYITGGKAVKLTWFKESASEPTRYSYEATGDALVLNPGQTWVEVVDSADNYFNLSD